MRQAPEAGAVVHEDERLSYGELNARTNRLAHHLIALGVKPDQPVAICLERSPAMVVGLDTVEFWFSEQRDLPAAKRFFRKALERHGRPDRVIIDGSQTNHEAIVSCDTTNRLQDRSRRRLKPIRIRRSQYLNNRIEQDHRRIKRRVRPMLGFKSTATAATILTGIEMMRKRQARYAFNPNPSLAKQFEILAG
ncbi:DDE-type integrase/transposase/recombinase (plasmid) [Mesorhizobium sp. AR07]|nr:DDE-type integrase/transposase/recombinase [Mesorhizobium sp. AR07]